MLLAYYGAWIAARPQGVFWSLDEGGKFIYLENVLATGHPGAPLAYPARILDPDLRFVPLFFSIQQGDALYSWWPVGFPLLSLPGYAAFGWWGLYLIPAACGALTAILVGAIARRLDPAARQWPALAAAAITGLATPVAFYSTMFWEHTANACFVVLTLYALLRARTAPAPRDARWLIAAGLTASAATFFRVDALPLALGFGLVLLAQRLRRAVWYGGAYVLATGGWLLATRVATGRAMGHNWDAIAESPLFAGLRESGVWFVAQTLYNAPAIGAFALPQPLLAFATICAVGALLAPWSRHARPLFFPAFLGVLGASAWVLLQSEGYRSVHGFLLIAPQVAFAGWALVPPRADTDRARQSTMALIVAALVCYAATYVARAWPAAGGLQWGPRYMLALYPLLVIAAALGMHAAWGVLRRGGRVVLSVLLVAGVAVGLGYELRGLTAARTTTRYYAEDAAALERLGAGPIVTPCTWFPMVVPRLYAQGNVLDVARSGLEAWDETAVAGGIARYRYVEIESCSTIPLDVLAARRAAGQAVHATELQAGSDLSRRAPAANP